MAAPSSVCSEERYILKIREWKRRNREWLEKEPKDDPSLFEKPHRAASIDTLSRLAQTLLGNFEDPTGPPVRFEDYDPSSYPRGRPAHTYTEKPPFQRQYLYQYRPSFSSSSSSSSARSLSSSRSPQSLKKLPVLELYGPASRELRPYLGQDHDSSQQKKSQNPGDIRVSLTRSAFLPPVAPLSPLHSSDSEPLHTDDKDTPERHHGSPGDTVKPSSLDLPRDAAPPQANEGNRLPSQTFAGDASSKSTVHGAPKAKKERKKRAKKTAALLPPTPMEPPTLQEPPTPMDIGKVPLKRRAEEGSGLAPITKDHAAKRRKNSPVPRERPKKAPKCRVTTSLNGRPLLKFDERQYPVEHHMKEAKKLKDTADDTPDNVSKAFSYLDAAMCFVERGIAMETDPQTPKLAYTMYAEALYLIRLILKLKILTDPSASATERDFKVVCMKCQSLLQMAMFHQRAELQWPACTMVAIPQVIQQVTSSYVNITTYFLNAHDVWEQAQELAPKCSGVLSDLDSALGPLNHSSSMASLVRYIRQGLHWLLLNTQAPL